MDSEHQNFAIQLDDSTDSIENKTRYQKFIEFLHTKSKKILSYKLSKGLLKISFGRQVRKMKKTNPIDGLKLSSFFLCFICQIAYVIPFT